MMGMICLFAMCMTRPSKNIRITWFDVYIIFLSQTKPIH